MSRRLSMLVNGEARRLATLRKPGSDPGHVVLNGRGYNYSNRANYSNTRNHPRSRPTPGD